MTKISRPFQIALVAVVLLAAVWFVALRGHSSPTESSASTPAASSSATSSAATSSASSASAGASSGSAAAQGASSGSGSGSGSGTPTYHGSAPGVDGLTRAIQKAHGAVAESEQNAKAIQQKSEAAAGSAQAQGSASTASQASQGSTTTASAGGATTAGGTAAKPGAAKTQAGSAGATAGVAPAQTANSVPVRQVRVEGELKQGKVAALLFWNPNGAVDQTVRRELQAAGHKLHGALAISVARSSEVGSFGSFTRTVQVYGTPTILLINPAGKTASVTGLTDVFSLEQAVNEIKQSK